MLSCPPARMWLNLAIIKCSQKQIDHKQTVYLLISSLRRCVNVCPLFSTDADEDMQQQMGKDRKAFMISNRIYSCNLPDTVLSSASP